MSWAGPVIAMHHVRGCERSYGEIGPTTAGGRGQFLGTAGHAYVQYSNPGAAKLAKTKLKAYLEENTVGCPAMEFRVEACCREFDLRTHMEKKLEETEGVQELSFADEEPWVVATSSTTLEKYVEKFQSKMIWDLIEV